MFKLIGQTVSFLIPFGSMFCLVADQAEVEALLANRPNARNSRCSGRKMEILENKMVQSPLIPEANGFYL